MKNMKSLVAQRAVGEVKEGMTIGLGTGSTAAYFIKHLAERCNSGLNIQAVATSQASEAQARSEGIEVLSIDEVNSVDLTVDGADNVNAKKDLIKGLGGALFREKITASISKKICIIVDESKLCNEFENFILPVEVNPFAWKLTAQKIRSKGFEGDFRYAKDQTIYITDNGNYIFDLNYRGLCDDPRLMDQKIQSIIGVVETGYFLGMADLIFVGKSSGIIEIR